MRSILAAAAALWTTQALACPGADAPCAIGSGSYHALTPEAPAKGVVMFLHGYGGRSEDQIRSKVVVDPILARGYAVVAPQATKRRETNTGGTWNSLARPERRDDIAFLRAVAADAAARLRLRGAPLIVAGFSGGGMMAWRLACEAPDSAAAYAPVAGLLWRPLPDRCAGPVRMLHTHGWADAVVPLEGRALRGGRLIQGDLFEGLALMRSANGCVDDDPDIHESLEGFMSRTWSDCTPGAQLAFALHPGGHSVPQGWADMALDWFEGLEVAAPARAGLTP